MSDTSLEIKKIDNTLIVSRLSGDTPLLWRCDLAAAKMATFSLNKLKTKTNLLMQPETGKAVTVIDFKNHDDALDAFKKVTDILTKGSEEKKQDEESSLGWFKSLVIFAAFFVLIYVLFGSFFYGNQTSQKQVTNTVQSEQTQKSIKDIEAGQAIPLDELFPVTE